MKKVLCWEFPYEIVLALMETYSNVDVEAVGLEQLLQWIINLPNFADDPELATEDVLNGILREWYEEGVP